ncbi:e3 ubiquitin ligase ARI10 [Fusarium pseudocircinatum]|uniref:E3 ubiquitin ligase ARI10 n=1 Tax=Fusarium pseudocircinatum TaxID=56676 RepID=A0A8H5P8U3_9HYPO|nr:e3 ubiquitin ligase ARI10 [Fusarium pseudocircinatum]
MDARQGHDEDTSAKEALLLDVVRRSYEASNQRDRQYQQTSEQHLGEEPDPQDDSSHDEAGLDSEMDVDDEGIECTSDMLGGLSDGDLDFQSGEDSEESEDHDIEMDRDSEDDMDLDDMLDDLSDGLSDFETEEDTEEEQPNGGSESQDDTSNDDMAVDEEAEDDSEDMLDPLSDGPSDDEQDGETEQQSHRLAAPEDPAAQESDQTETKECTACYSEDLPATLVQEFPCGHAFCRQCLIRTFAISLSLASYFPARCCDEEIPLEAIETHMPRSDVQLYREKLVEHRTIDRTYCSNRQCLEFIPPDNTSADREPCYRYEAECPACKEITCTTCKDKGHTGPCEKQVEMDQTLDLAKREGWKRCSRCGHLIEKAEGCTHMSMSPNQLANPVNLLNYTSQFVTVAMSSATTAVENLIIAIVNRMSIRPLNTNLTNLHSLSQRSLMSTVLDSHLCCATTIGSGLDPAAVECVVRENTPTPLSVQPAPCGTITLRSDDLIYMIDVKSVFDPDCVADSCHVLLKKIPQGTTLAQIADAVCGVYTTHIVNGAVGG